MTTYQRKVPKFIAAQFNGTTESINRMHDLFEIDRYMLTVGGHKATVDLYVVLEHALCKVSLSNRDWLVLDMDAGTLSPVSEADFKVQFEVAK